MSTVPEAEAQQVTHFDFMFLTFPSLAQHPYPGGLHAN